nr:hypothetical protein [Streptomyces dangxiongensis]
MTALLGAVAVLLLGACGGRRAGAHLPWTTMQPSSVTAVRVGADDRTLSVDVPVPSGAAACVRHLRAVATDRVNGAVWVEVTYSSPSMDRGSGCTREKPATTRVTLPKPLGGLDVIVDHYTHFTRHGAEPPALRRCGPLGCDPPRTGCTAASYDQAVLAADVPNHTYRDSERCDGEWLVLDLSWRTGPACDDTSAPGCSSRLGARWFFRAGKSGWVPLLDSAAGGCRDVRRAEPAFPTALCASLEPLRASLRPSHPPVTAPPSVAP